MSKAAELMKVAGSKHGAPAGVFFCVQTGEENTLKGWGQEFQALGICGEHYTKEKIRKISISGVAWRGLNWVRKSEPGRVNANDRAHVIIHARLHIVEALAKGGNQP